MIKEYVEGRLLKVLDWIKPLDVLEGWRPNKMPLVIEFNPIPYRIDTAEAFIITGSKDKPAGVSTLKDDFVLFFDPKRKGTSVYCHADVLKDYIRANFKDLKQGNSDHYQHIGYFINMKDFTSSCEKSLSVLTSPESHDS
jgi:hypothetical protein